jgi:hypothetical protein
LNKFEESEGCVAFEEGGEEDLAVSFVQDRDRVVDEQVSPFLEFLDFF